jgi:outer membrane protein TolC/ABC-type uncharacterized transport system substrate-binding protein
MISIFNHRKYLLSLVINLILINLIYANSDKILKIGVLFDGPWEKNQLIWDSFHKEILELIGNEYIIQFPDDKIIESDFTQTGIKKSLNQLLSDPQLDLIITMGLYSSQIASQQGKLPKPTIAPFILDYKLQSISYKKGKSGIKNLNYVSRINFIEDNLLALKELVEYDKVALLFDPDFIALIPNFENVIKNKLSKLKLQYQIINTRVSAREIINAIDDDVQAVYMDDMISFDPDKIEKLVDGLKSINLPSISAYGIKDVEAGIMMSRSPTDFFMRRARRVAVNVQRILMGEDPEDIPVVYSEPKRIALNIETAKSIDVFPSWELITDIYLVGSEKQETGPKLSLFSVVDEALKLNIELKAQTQLVKSVEKEVNKAWSNFLPQIDVSVTGLQIDKDRAKASFGTQAEQTISGSVQVSQLIYSDDALANITIQKEIQNSRKSDLERFRFDLIQDVAVTYLNILRAKTYEQIQEENLKVTQKNYETAKIRESIGSAGPGETYRWEAEVASGQQAVISATVQREIAEQALNRILGYPLNRKFITVETDINDKRLITSKTKLFDIINNPWAYEVLSDFLAQEAVKSSPEIQTLDATIAAQERFYTSTGRAFWLPTLAAQAQYDNVFDRSGEGSKVPGITPPEDQSWNVALNASLPIFLGGSKIINHQQAYLDLQKLKFDRESIMQKIEQRTHIALKNSRYSGARIRLSRRAADAARKNLDIITNAYAGGAISIIDLLDAQNAALVTDQVASNAVFNFLIDIMNIERAVGRFDFFISEQEQNAWIERFEAFYNEKMK